MRPTNAGGRISRKAPRWIAWLFPVLLGICAGLCSSIYASGGVLDLRDSLVWFGCLPYALLYCGCFALAERIVGLLQSRSYSPEPGRFRGLFPMEMRLASVVIGAAAILIAWLPYLLYLYPGVYWNDTTIQLVEFLGGSGVLDDHNNVLDTVVIGLFARAGYNLTGSYFNGTYALILLQSALMAIALSASCCLLVRFNVGWRARLALLAFFALFPFFPCMMSTLCKDTIHLPVEVTFVLLVAEVWRTRGAAIRRIVAPLAVVVALCCLTKKSGAIVCVVSVAALMLATDGWRRKGALACSVVLALVASNAAVPAIIQMRYEVLPGGRQEMLSVPLQALANVYQWDRGLLSEADLEVMEACYPIELEQIPERYTWMASDGVKLYDEPEEPRYGELLGLFVRQTFEHPRLVAEAWGGLVADWFTFESGISLKPLMESRTDTPACNALAGWDPQPDSSGGLARFYGVVGSLPGVSAFFSKALWMTVLPTLCLFLCLRGKGAVRLVALVVPLLINVAVNLAGPTSAWSEAVRYAVPMVACVPVVLFMVVGTLRAQDRADFPLDTTSLGGDCSLALLEHHESACEVVEDHHQDVGGELCRRAGQSQPVDCDDHDREVHDAGGSAAHGER